MLIVVFFWQNFVTQGRNKLVSFFKNMYSISLLRLQGPFLHCVTSLYVCFLFCFVYQPLVPEILSQILALAYC
jgi:hypothetical protein